MLNTDVFKFELVDRNSERKEIDIFLNNHSKCDNYCLWIHGKRGTGKSYLLTEYIAMNKQFTSVYVNVDINNVSSGIYIKSFISQLNKTADLKFVSYVRANYKSIAEIGKKAANILLNLADIDDIGLDEFTATITNYYVTKHGEKENTISVVKKYIAEALKKSKNLLFLLDNFTQCDMVSLDILTQIIHEFRTNTQIKFIVCTTDDDLDNRKDIKSVLSERIPNKQLLIAPFQQKKLFARMLEQNFKLDEDNVKLLAQAFELCQGYPQRLKEVLINLYTIQGIQIDGNKAHIALDVFRKLLIKEEMSFDMESLCKERKEAKIILKIIVLWGMPVTSNVLFDFLKFLADIDFISVLKEEIAHTIQVFESMHILDHIYDERILMIKFKHDSLKVAVYEYFRDDCSIPFLHFNIYEYLMTQQENKHPYWNCYYTSLCAYHSYASKADGWIDINYNYGYSFYEAELFYEAESIFSRLESVVISLTGEQLLTIGITFFKCGYYSKANNILINIQLCNLMNRFSLEQNTMFYIFLARTHSCILNNKEALYAISQAEELSKDDPELRIATLGTKQSILFLAPGKFIEAEELFNNLVSENAEIRGMPLIYMSSMDYYEGEKSLTYLKKGLDLTQKFSDNITKGKILNNIGFEYLRCGKYQEAQQFFLNSISTLEKIQPHQQTYPYSNLAVLNMICKEWENALDNIVEALFWNRSEYASIVLKTNRMLCYFYQKNQQWENIWNEIFEYIISLPDVDDKIYKKACINLALLALKSQRYREGKQLMELCKEHLKNEWSHGKYRFIYLYFELTNTKIEALSTPEPCLEKYYCEIEFEPWLINFSHD